MLKKSLLTRRLKAVQKGTAPEHIAIIMDGNGRWARRRGLPRVAGHRAGTEAIRRCLRGLKELDVSYLTLFAFSTENWRRPQSEVDYLMKLPGQFIGSDLDTMMENNIKLGIVGDEQSLPAHTRTAITKGIETTKDNTGLQLNFALNYGGREEILRATRMLGRQCQQGELDPGAISSQHFQDVLYTRDMPDPDLVIRTSGEVRISNFLLWQVAYAELCFLDIYWPDFNELHLYNAVHQFQRRGRRFGGL